MDEPAPKVAKAPSAPEFWDVVTELIPLPATTCAPPDVVVVVTVAVTVVAVTVVVIPGAATVVVDSVVTELVAVFVTVAELALGAEEDVLEYEMAVDEEVAEPATVEVAAELLACEAEEPTSPQPARREVDAARNSSVAKTTLNLFKRATKR
jgi:hypothetical protein